MEYIEKNGTLPSKNFLSEVEQGREMEETDFHDTINAGDLVLFCCRPRNGGINKEIT